ncbi:MAG: glycosyltransferase [Chloroflexota bacterium]
MAANLESHRVSLIITVKNEADSLPGLLDSLCTQTRAADEIVVTDGGSTDNTVGVLESYGERGLPIKVLVRPGCNISEGRNEAIQTATGDIIVATDAGVRLTPEWLCQLVQPYDESEPPDIVCGFFRADASSTFELALGATTLPDWSDIDLPHFLPSSRSVAFRRSAWEQVGGYPEWLDYCEDIVFDLKLRDAGFKFALAPLALVYFRPRSSFRKFFLQYYRYARGDGKASLFGRRHAVRYATYALGPLAFLAGLWYKVVWLPLALAATAYLWTPYRRLLPQLHGGGPGRCALALGLPPLIRLVGDAAKMIGYPIGCCWRVRHRGGRGWR